MTRRYRMARPEEHRALMVQDAQAFGDSTTSVSIDRSVARTRVEELRVLEEDGNRLGLLLARHQPVRVPSCFIAAWTRPRHGAVQTAVSEKPIRPAAD